MDEKHKSSEVSPLIEKRTQLGQNHSKWKFKFVEPLPVIYIASAAILEPVLQQYVYLRIAEEFGNQKTNTSQADELSQLCSTNKSSPAFKMQQATQSATSQFLMYLTIVQVLLCCPTLLLLGSFINRLGRKVALYMTFSCRLVYAITIASIISFDLPIQILFIGVAIDGISGTMEAAMMAFNTYIADVTLPGNHRAFRMMVLEGVLGMTSGTATIAAGFLVTNTNFLVPICTVLALLIVGLTYLIFFLEESYDLADNNEDTKSISCNILKTSLEQYIWDTPDKRRSRLLLALLGGFFTAPALTATSDVQVLYVLNSPFCWTSDHIGNFLAAQIYSRWLLALVLVKFLQCYLSDIDIAILGNFSSFLAIVILAFAKDDIVIYISACAGLFAYVALPNIRSAMSKLVEPEEIGSLFAGFYFVEAISTLVFEIVFNTIYSATISRMSGTVFLLIGVMLLVAIFIFIVYKAISKKMMRQHEYILLSR